MNKKKIKYRVIYQILNTKTRKIYIGSAENYWNRMWCHIYLLRNNRHHSIKLQNSWNKHGEEVFQFSIVEKLGNEDDIILKEQYYLDLLKPYLDSNGYNISPTASTTLGHKMSEESKLKMSLAKKGKPLSDKHLENIRKMRKNWSPNLGNKGAKNRLSKPIVQYDLNGQFIKEWEGINVCSESIGVAKSNIIGVLKNRLKQANGFIFKYK
jgi:group I intron endonuclease